MRAQSACFLVLLTATGCTPEAGPSFVLSGGGTAGAASAGLSTEGANDSSDAPAGDATGGSEGSEQPGETSGGAQASTGTASDGDSGDGVESGDFGTTAATDDTQGARTGDESSTGAPFDGVIDIGIVAHNDCSFTVEPVSITVPEGTAFTVNWVSAATSEVEFDVAKIDPFNQVPIVLDMAPGDAVHDEVHAWCGNLFSGTFDFRLTSCFDPTYIEVDCGG